MDDNTYKVRTTVLPGINFLILRKDSIKNRFFYSGDKEFTISLVNLATLLTALIRQGIISPRFLEGILEECRE